MTGLPSLTRRGQRLLAGTWMGLCALLACAPAPAAAAATEEPPLLIYRQGADEDAPARLHGPAYYLRGDGAPDAASFSAYLHQLSDDPVDVVVLGASYPNWDGECRTVAALPQVNSCTTIVIRQPRDASDPSVLAALQGAEVVYFRGGDQCNFVRWRQSPVPALVQALVRRGGGTGGGSAGLAIQGALAVYDGCQGSVSSPLALADPYRDSVSFSERLFDWDVLQDTLTDSHFVKRDRMGRLMAFLCRQLGSGQTAHAWGLGVNEGTAVVIDRDGVGTVHGDTAYMVLADRPDAGCRQDSDPVDYAGYKVWRLEAGHSFDFAQRPQTGFYRVDVEQGLLSQDPYREPERGRTRTAALRTPDRLSGH